MKRNVNKIVLIYLLFGLFWILITDNLTNYLIDDKDIIDTIQLIKGWIFVGITTLVLYILLRKNHQKSQNYINEIDENKYRLQRILDNSEQIVLRYDLNTEIFKILNYNKENFLDIKFYKDQYSENSFYQMLEPEFSKKFKKSIKQSIKNRKSGLLEYKIEWNNDFFVWINQKNFVLENIKNEIVAVEIIISNISKYKLIENELDAYRQYLESIINERTNELSQITEELASANEEQYKINNELKKEISERKSIEKELKKYKKYLERLVKIRTAKLKRSENRLKHLSDNIPKVALFSVISNNDKDFKIQYTSAKFKEVTGIDIKKYPSDLDLFYENIVPECINEVIEKQSQAAEKLTMFETEFEYCYNNNCKWLQMLSMPVKYKTNHILWETILIDITDKKQAEQELKESNSKFQLISEQSLMSITIIQDDIIKYANNAFIELIGYSLEEIYNWQPKEIQKIIYYEDRNFVMDQLERKQNNDPNIFPNYIFRIVHKNSQILWVEIFSKTIKYKSKTADLITLINITDKRKAQFELKAKEVSYQSLFNLAAEGILIGDPQGNIIDANKSICTLTKYSKDELIGKNISKLFSKHVLNSKPLRYDLLQKGLTLTNERMLLKKDETQIAIEMSSKRMPDGNYQSFIRNISERKQIEQKVINAIIDTEEKERKRFAEDIHDGVGPLLSSMKYYVNMLENEEEKSSRTELKNNLFEVIDEAILSVREISNNLSPHILEDFGLNAAIKTFCSKIPKKQNIKINLQLSDNTNQLNKRIEVVLYRVVIELINNTLKYAEAKNINIILKRAKNELYLSYKDDGIGFDPLKINNKGFGLLYIQNRIKSLQGVFDLKTKTNNGVDVIIKIPTE